MLHLIELSSQRLQAIGVLHYLSFIVLSVLLSDLIGVYIYFLPPHKRPWTRNKYVMPAGPRGWPIVGSLIPWLRARNGGKMVPWLIEQAKHGEMTTLSMGSKTWVLLNTPRAVNEILSKRASATHERPYFPIAGSLVSRDRRYFLLPSDDLLDGRRLIHRLLLGGPSASLDSEPPGSKSKMCSAEGIIQTESLNLLKLYLDEPQKWYQHNYHYPASIIYQMVTGTKLEKSISELDDFQLVTSSFLMSMNSHFVDFFPQLATLVPVPLQFWRAKWMAMGEFHYTVMRRWWDGMLRSINPTSTVDKGLSFVRDVLESEYASHANTIPTPPSEAATDSSSGQDTGKDLKDSMSLQEERAMYLTMFVLSAGADNPRMTLNAFIMACLSHPEAMRRGRKDLDGLLGGLDSGKMRLPTLDDLSQLPYVVAIVKEVLRWRPTVPLMPQRVSVRHLDVELDGVRYTFPKGTEFLVNTVAVCSHTSQNDNGPEGYESPEVFSPERWFGNDKDGRSPRGIGGSYTSVEQDLWQFAFSAGRRSCSGYKLAQKELFLAMARLLYCFDFVAPGTEGKEGKVNDKVLNAFSLGEPFPVEVRVRSVQHENLIRCSV